VRGLTNNRVECLGSKGGKEDSGARVKMDEKMKRKGGRNLFLCFCEVRMTLATPQLGNV